MSFEDLVEANVWHDAPELEPLIKRLLVCATKEHGDFSWHWSRHPMGGNVKYVSIRIDMRDGGFILCDGEGKRISIDQLEEMGKE